MLRPMSEPRSLRRLLLALAAGGALFAGCTSGPPPVLRNSDLMRDLFYPPAFPRGELGPDTPGARFDHADLAAVLEEAVGPDGRVDYAIVKRLEPRLDRYLVNLGNVPLDSLSRYERLALLINAYNAFTLKMIVENPGVRSPGDVPASGGWTEPTWVIDLGATSIEQLEHDWIRRTYRDPRIHFALVRGALGSPPLRAAPYTGKDLPRQLNEQAARTLADPRFCEWVPARKTLRLGALFDRYRSDFADDEPGLVRALAAWMPPATAQALRAEGSFRIEFTPFDWALNGKW